MKPRELYPLCVATLVPFRTGDMRQMKGYKNKVINKIFYTIHQYSSYRKLGI